jgi:hypothetical protein
MPNHFSWHPIIEVAVLFAGIFATMIPALALLEAKGASLGVAVPWHYFWATGGLSSFLDNAPTYLVFTSVAQGQAGVATVGALTSTQLIPGLGVAPAGLLAAISCGAVMWGMTMWGTPSTSRSRRSPSTRPRMPSGWPMAIHRGARAYPLGDGRLLPDDWRPPSAVMYHDR